MWGTTFVLLGYFAGAAWQRVAGYATEAGLALLALIIIGLVLGRVLRNVREGGETVPDRLAGVRSVAWVRRSLPRTSAWMARRVDTSSPRGFVLTLVVLIGAFSAWLFGAVAQDVVVNEEAVRYDPGVMRFALAHREAWLTTLMKGITWVGSNATLVPIVLGICIWLLWRRRAGALAIVVAVALGGANVLFQVTKALVARPRPPVAFRLMQVSGSAFPSGHAALALAGWGAVAMALGSGRSLKVRVLVSIAAAVLVLLIALSRVYLGVHWFTDVVGGLALGGSWLCVIGAVLLWAVPPVTT